MGFWNNILQLAQTRPDILDKITQYYGTIELGNVNFPFIVRHYLCDWIEQRLSNCALPKDIPSDDPRLFNEANFFFDELFPQIERKRIELNASYEQLMAINLMNSTESFRRRYRIEDGITKFYDPVSLYVYIRNCVEVEKQILGWSPDSEDNFPFDSELSQNMNRINRVISEIKSSVSGSESLCHDLKLAQYQYRSHNGNLSVLQISNSPQDNQFFMQHQPSNFQTMLNQIVTNRTRFFENIAMILNQVEAILAEVINEHLTKWRIDQRLAGNGLRNSNAICIDIIRNWCQDFANILWNIREQIKQNQNFRPNGQNMPDNDTLSQLMSKSTNLFVYLITRSVIVEKQPAQVLKTNLKCSTQIEFLIGNTLNIRMKNPPGKVMIVSEAKAQIVQQTNNVPARSACGDMDSDTGVIVENNENRLLIGFPNAKLKNIKRAERRGAENVMEEKFALLFQSEFSFFSSAEEVVGCSVWTLSLPVTVMVHGTQDARGSATILWDYAFADINRVPFVVPENVTWSNLIEALNMKFTSLTDRSLSQDNIKYLADKLRVSSENQLVSWSRFARDHLPDRNFTFWEWFNAALRLTREHLSGIWSENYIIGFIAKDLAEKYLIACPVGTFLLRFSDSELGGISIAWRSINENGNPCVLHFQPFTGKDFGSRILADRVMDLDQLTTLFPHTPKADAFSRFIHREVPSRTGYIPAPLRNVLPPNITHRINNQRNFIENNVPTQYQNNVQIQQIDLSNSLNLQQDDDFDFSDFF